MQFDNGIEPDNAETVALILQLLQTSKVQLAYAQPLENKDDTVVQILLIPFQLRVG